MLIIIELIVLFVIIVYLKYSASQNFFHMDPDEAKYMRTERKPGNLDVHPTINAIILNYEIDVQILGAKEVIIYGEKKNLKKIIEVPMINSRTDCYVLAKEVVYQCDLIHHSRLSEVEQTIYYLKKRKLAHISTSAKVNVGILDLDHLVASDEPNYNNLSDYIELLYEGMPEKIKGAQLIQLLARDPDNLDALSKNETVISALGRVLREDWKRSIVLSTHLVFTFFCFSMYSRFHEVILKCKVGSICMDIIDYELRRYDKWIADLEGLDAPRTIPIVQKSCSHSASLSEIPRSRIPEPVRPKSGNFSDTNMKDAMEGSVYEDLTTSTECIDDRKLTEAERAKRYRTLVKKQEHLLRVAFYLLLNIAEDESIEEKMMKRNIVGLLVKTLERENDELLVLVVTFLKKLSIMQCNKDTMASLGVVEKLPRLLGMNSPDLVHLTLKLLYNLSFDLKLRYKIVKMGLIPTFISLLSDDRHQEIVLKLLYNVSYDDDVKTQFAECVGLIIDMLLLNIGSEGNEVLVALCINLATDSITVQHMIKNNRIQSLMMRAFNYQDHMIMKMLRNLSDHRIAKAAFVEFVGDIVKVVTETNASDFVVECLGVLSNLNLPELDWAEIFKHFDLLKWIEKSIKNCTDLELVLQIIVLLGTAAGDEGCAALLCNSNLISVLIELLKTHQEDDEIVMQIIYVFFATISHGSNINNLAEKTEAPAYLLDLLQDTNKSIRKLCNMCLNMIADHNKTWTERIKFEKFKHHNAQWLEMVDSQQFEREEEEEEEAELPPYLNTEYLSTAVVPAFSDLSDNAQDLELISEKELECNYFDKPDMIPDLQVEAI